MRKILIASKNLGKIREYSAILKPLGYEVVSLVDFNDSFEVEETGDSFQENAMIKAKSAAQKYHMPTIADDSGLEVAALNNHPGIHSRRYSKESTDSANNALLLKNMNHISNRKARFVCEIVYYDLERGYSCFHGEITGEILNGLKGKHGFGYDPLFFIPNENKTMAELDESKKNQISHRAIALNNCIQALKDISR